ncbi:hypothetical protein N1851_011811 [Merluccius polli]|uniref:CARD domain-containing protein n=1 Tax=Merluccius polli TaxID=89951 RepID=A0AA47P6C3_MERPO|nr:hypothetical protein N1851_011811 [Merluccius polli]
MGEDRGLLRRLKPKLIDILSADPELVLQECHALNLVTDAGYKMVRPQQVSTEKVTALLDHVYDRGSEAAHGLMELLRGDVFLENFPRLSFLKTPDVDQPRPSTVPELVTQKQLMKVAGAITGNWKEVGILVLDVSSEELDAIKQDNSTSTMQAFRMLYVWRCCQREQATAAKLYFLLSTEKLAIAPESLVCLQESN